MISTTHPIFCGW